MKHKKVTLYTSTLFFKLLCDWKDSIMVPSREAQNWLIHPAGRVLMQFRSEWLDRSFQCCGTNSTNPPFPANFLKSCLCWITMQLFLVCVCDDDFSATLFGMLTSVICNLLTQTASGVMQGERDRLSTYLFWVCRVSDSQGRWSEPV